jgi:hypothetical protein
MAINKSFQRPKLTQTVAKSLNIDTQVSEDNGKFALDIYSTITNDNAQQITKLLARIVITPSLNRTTLAFTEKIYTFTGAVANYDPQNPIMSVPTNLGTETSNIDLDKFLTEAGDAREDDPTPPAN